MLNRLWFKVDWTLTIPVIILIIIGIIMIFSTSSIVGFSNYNDSYFFITRHLIFLVVALGAFVVGLLTPYQVYKKHFNLITVATLVLLVLTLSPLGVEVGGAQRWLNLGFIRFQPAECAKFVIVIFIAAGLTRKQHILNHFVKGCVPLCMGTVVISSLLILQPDLGNVALILMVVLSLFFLSNIPIRHIVLLGIIAAIAVGVIILSHPYQMQRVTSFLDPWDDPLGKSYHAVQSFMAIGSGGITGVGLGESKLKYFYLPLQYSDFIFSIICEEGGFLAAMLVILMYLVILLKTYYIVKNCSDKFAFYLGMGCALFICLQAFINIAVVIGLLPITGIPLTFISYGGTSLITSLFYIGIILNISNSVQLKNYSINSK